MSDVYIYRYKKDDHFEKVVETRSVAMGVMVDLDIDGNVLGVEILDAKRIEVDGVPTEDLE